MVISKIAFAVCREKSWSNTVWNREDVTPGPRPPVTKTWYFLRVVEPEISTATDASSSIIPVESSVIHVLPANESKKILLLTDKLKPG